MSYGDDRKPIEPKPVSNPRTDPADGPSSDGWLDALNTFLDRALKADIDTGC